MRDRGKVRQAVVACISASSASSSLFPSFPLSLFPFPTLLLLLFLLLLLSSTLSYFFLSIFFFFSTSPSPTLLFLFSVTPFISESTIFFGFFFCSRLFHFFLVFVLGYSIITLLLVCSLWSRSKPSNLHHTHTHTHTHAHKNSSPALDQQSIFNLFHVVVLTQHSPSTLLLDAVHSFTAPTDTPLYLDFYTLFSLTPIRQITTGRDFHLLRSD